MTLIATIKTENEKVRFAIHKRDDGMFSIEEERYQAGDEYTGPYWNFDQVGLFGSVDDVNEWLATVSPKTTEKFVQPN